ncbi:hypothetical protein V6Z12_A07G169400 [Gossypium hirsutum]
MFEKTTLVRISLPIRPKLQFSFCIIIESKVFINQGPKTATFRVRIYFSNLCHHIIIHDLHRFKRPHFTLFSCYLYSKWIDDVVGRVEEIFFSKSQNT